MNSRSRPRELTALSNRPLTSFANDPLLAFRHAHSPGDIAELARTENYGAGGVTDVEQVTRWWSRNRRGNLLAVYDGSIIGGIDIWPITAQACEAFRRGDLNERTLGPEHIESDATSRRNHWYIGSISLDAGFQAPRARAEILLRLVLAAITECMHSAPAFPANVLAEAWTHPGRRMLVRFLSFRPVPPPEGAATGESRLYEKEFGSAAELGTLVDRLAAVLGARVR